MSKSEKEERDWNGERLLSAGEQASNLTHGTRRKLHHVLRDLAPLEKQGEVEGFFNNNENAAQLGGLIEDIRDVMMDYQVCASNPSSSPHLIFLSDSTAAGDLRPTTRDPR